MAKKDSNSEQAVKDRLLNIHNTELTKLEMQRDTWQLKIARYRKQIKADGISLKAFDKTRARKKMKPEDVRKEVEEEIAYARAMNVPIGTQWSLEGFQPDEVEAETLELAAANDAVALGIAAGKRGDPRASNTCKPEGSPAFVGWDAGWVQGDISRQEKEAHKAAEKERKKAEKAAAKAAAKNGVPPSANGAGQQPAAH